MNQQHYYGEQQHQYGYGTQQHPEQSSGQGSQQGNYGPAGGREYEPGNYPQRLANEQQYGNEMYRNPNHLGHSESGEYGGQCQASRAYPMNQSQYGRAYEGGLHGYQGSQQGNYGYQGEQYGYGSPYYQAVPQRQYARTQGNYPSNQYGMHSSGYPDPYFQQGNVGHRTFGPGNTVYGNQGYEQGSYGGNYQDQHANQGYNSGSHQFGMQAGGNTQHFDPHYNQWRNEQIRKLDEDYHSYNQERYGKFSDEFDQWRKTRKASRPNVPRSESEANDNNGYTGGREQDNNKSKSKVN